MKPWIAVLLLRLVDDNLSKALTDERTRHKSARIFQTDAMRLLGRSVRTGFVGDAFWRSLDQRELR